MAIVFPCFMKSFLSLGVIMFLSLNLRAQKTDIGSDEVIKSVKLLEVNVNSSKLNLFTSIFNLNRYSTRSQIELLCSENIAIYIPSEIDTFLLIKSVEIPFKNLGGRIINNPKFFIKTSNNPSDSLTPIIPKEIKITKNKMIFIFNQEINLNLKYSGFFFVFYPNCSSSDYSCGYQLKFTYNYHSKLTFKYNKHNDFIVNDFRKEILYDKEGFPNWQIKLSFITAK